MDNKHNRGGAQYIFNARRLTLHLIVNGVILHGAKRQAWTSSLPKKTGGIAC